MSTNWKNLLSVVIIAVVFFASGAGPASAKGSHFISVDLRVDGTAIPAAADYRVQVAASALPTQAFPSYTAGWLGINTSSTGTSPIQAGLMADQGGLYWYVYAESAVTCLQGSPWWGDDAQTQIRGCKGDAFQYVELESYHTFELVSYIPGEWIARVYDIADQGHDLAVITVTNTGATNGIGSLIYDADVNFQEAYSQDLDPQIEGSFQYFRPQYRVLSENGDFVDWPVSVGSNRNILYNYSTTNQNFCGSVYAAKLFMGHTRAWYAGTPLAEQTMLCDAALFSEVYLPVAIR